MQHVRGRSATWITILCVVAGAGCARVDAPQPGSYRGVIKTPGGDAPVLIDVIMENEAPVLYVSRGGQRSRARNVSIADGKLTARMPDSSAELHLDLFRDRMKGDFITPASNDSDELKFEARRGETHLFYDKSQTDNADVAGYWELTATHRDDTRVEALLQLNQVHDRVTGTLSLPSNERYNVDGQVHGDEVRLVSLAGDTVELYALEVANDGTLQGEYWRGSDESGEITARRANGEVEAGY